MVNYLDERQDALRQYHTMNQQTPSFQDKTNTLVNQMMQHTQAQAPQMNMPNAYQGFNPNTNQGYQAAMRTAMTNAQQATGNAMVQLGSKGIGNSSMVADRAAQIQQQALGRVSDTLLPQYEQMDYGRYRDNVGDQFKVNEINYGRSQDQQRNASELARFMSDLTQRQVDNSFRESDITGNYLPAGAMDAMNNILSLKQQAERSGVTPDQMAQFKSQADQQRALLQRMGIDPSIVGFDADYNQAAQNVASFKGTPTMQSQNMQFNQGMAQQDQQYRQMRDQISDQQYQQKFDEDARRFGLEYAADQAYRSGQLKQQQQGDLYKQWEMTGQAPVGIHGVDPGTRLYDQVGERQEHKPIKIDNKASTDNTSYFKSQISGKSGITKEQAKSYVQSNADHLTDSDYRALMKWLDDEEGHYDF